MTASRKHCGRNLESPSSTTLRASTLRKTTGIPYILLDEAFEWDDDKAAANLRKHGVTFEDARGVFRDPLAIELVDDREAYGEDRFVLIGMTQSRVLVVVYVLRDRRNRIISARKAEPNERRAYREQDYA